MCPFMSRDGEQVSCERSCALFDHGGCAFAMIGWQLQDLNEALKRLELVIDRLDLGR